VLRALANELDSLPDETVQLGPLPFFHRTGWTL